MDDRICGCGCLRSLEEGRAKLALYRRDCKKKIAAMGILKQRAIYRANEKTRSPAQSRYRRRMTGTVTCEPDREPRIIECKICCGMAHARSLSRERDHLTGNCASPGPVGALFKGKVVCRGCGEPYQDNEAKRNTMALVSSSAGWNLSV